MEEIKMNKEELAKLLDTVSSEAASKAVEAKVKELGLGNKFSPAYKGQFSGKSDEEMAKMEVKEKMAGVIKAIYHKDGSSLAKLKTMTENVGAAGGFVVPEEFAAEVFRVVEDFGLVPKLARVFPMTTDTMNVPRLSSSVTVYFPGEANAGTASQPVFQSVVLSAKTCVGITPMSNELLADANISVVELLTELFAEAIAGMLDNQGLVGSGAPFVGILNDPNTTIVQPANGNSTFTLCSTPDNLRTLISNVKPWSMQGAAFFMHRSVWALVQTTKASTAGDYFISAANPVLSGIAAQGFPTAMAGTLWGYPVYLSDKMPNVSAVSTKYVIFGNLKNLFYGKRDEMAVAISQEASVAGVSLFETNQSAVRVTTRIAIAVGLPTAFSVLETSAS